MLRTCHSIFYGLLAYNVAALHIPDAGGPRHKSKSVVPKMSLGAQEIDEGSSSSSCAHLKNIEGTHYIIQMEVGTPPQEFSLIPDTGSPWVIIADTNCTSCACKSTNKCFAEKASSTLNVPRNEFGGPEIHSLMFGSGPIQVAVASDAVQVKGADVHAQMDSGVLLMMSHQLSFSGPFEGIAGLGIPEHLLEAGAKTGGSHSYQDGFLEKAGVHNFSVCFSDDGWGGSGGVLNFGGLKPHAVQLQITHETMHWQTPFYGLSVGGARANFCKTPSRPDQHSPCAAVFDSGTTYVLGPMAQIMPLFESFCDQWARCKVKYNELYRQAQKAKSAINSVKTDQHRPVPTVMDKSMVFQLLLNNCSGWLNNDTGVSEMPPLKLHIGSRNGHKEELTLDPWDFIVAQEDNATEILYSEFNGVQFVNGYRRTPKRVIACTAAFATMEFPTNLNGPAWIIGMPIFYSYVVTYNTGVNPPTVSFDNRPCGSCTGETGGRQMFETPSGPRKHPHGRQPRRLAGEPHLPATARHITL